MKKRNQWIEISAKLIRSKKGNHRIPRFVSVGQLLWKELSGENIDSLPNDGIETEKETYETKKKTRRI